MKLEGYFPGVLTDHSDYIVDALKQCRISERLKCGHGIRFSNIENRRDSH